VRILCTCQPAYGHFHPMLPLARALLDAGHDVAFATADGFCPRVQQAGFAAFPAGMDAGQTWEETSRRFPELDGLPPQEGWRFGTAAFTGVAAPAIVTDLVSIVRQWAPDLIVHEASEFGGPLVATQAGIPYAHHSLGPLRPAEVSELAGEIVAPLWREWNLEPEPLGAMFHYLYLDICPPRLQAPHAREIAVSHLVRPVDFRSIGHEGPPGWINELHEVPTVYVTLGTVFNRNIAVFSAILEGLSREAVNVVVTVGHDNDPASLGPQPGNVYVERYVDQSLLLPHVDVVVTHGGSGSMLGALAHGLPMLIVPQGADQFRNADRCVAHGAGRRLLPAELSPDSVRTEVRVLLDQPTHRETARRFQKEIEQMPGPDEAVTLLEHLARERVPLVRPA
jgi:UDP:flavonoid glycosyltransferase YjiC (YdhE family)